MNDNISVKSLIIPRFYKVAHSIVNHEYTHYWLKGGRGSTKSSFIAIMIVLGLYQHENTNAIVFRKIGYYLKESVYEQLIWALDMLNLLHEWRIFKSPLMLERVATGQRIIFRGADDSRKSKSIKLHKGYFAYVWYEEVDEFNSMEEINVINQSLLRGGDDFWVFYSYNPPKSLNAWVNYESSNPRTDKMVRSSSYLDVPQEWLGKQFIIEAEICREQNYNRYMHEFLGIPIGTGGAIFENVEHMEIDDKLIQTFKQIRHGIDFGFAVDPFCFISCYYDRKNNVLYVFDEIYQQKLLINDAVELVREKLRKYNERIIIADSANPQDIATYNHSGIRVYGAKKIAGSVGYGIKFLQSIYKIYVDRKKAPNTYKELVQYEYEKNRAGEFISAYPDRDNHAIDALRYALENDMPSRNRGIRIMK